MNMKLLNKIKHLYIRIFKKEGTKKQIREDFDEGFRRELEQYLKT